jgi:hypothetical protein
MLLSNTARLSAGGWGDAQKLHAVLGEQVQCFDVGASHEQILNPHNDGFARHLRACVAQLKA